MMNTGSFPFHSGKEMMSFLVIPSLIALGFFFGWLDHRDRWKHARITARIMAYNDPEITEEVKHEFPWQYFCALFCFKIAYFFYYYVNLEASTHGTDGKVIKWGLLGVATWSLIYYFLALWDICLITLMPDKVTCERTTAHTHVIIAAHKAADSLREMLPQVLKTFDPDCVWVADNGWKDDEAEKLCKEFGIHYLFNKVGNKCNALNECALRIKHDYGDKVKNVVLLDDDTVLEDTFFIRHDLLANPKVGGYCIAIAVDRNPPYNIWEAAIDYEYRSISFSGEAASTCGTLRFIHGICAVYKLDIMLEFYPKNLSLPGGLPFGEDGYAGLDLRRANYSMVQDNQNVCLSFCPRRLFPPLTSTSREQGYGASSLWKQRGARWFLSWPRHFLAELGFLLTYKTGSLIGFISYRVYFFKWFFLSWVSIIWCPFLVWVLVFEEIQLEYLVALKIYLYLTGMLTTMIRTSFFSAKLRRGMHWSAPFVVPILGLANSLLRLYGFIIAIYDFIPFKRVGKMRIVLNEENYREIILGRKGENSVKIDVKETKNKSLPVGVDEATMLKPLIKPYRSKYSSYFYRLFGRKFKKQHYGAVYNQVPQTIRVV